MKCPCENCLLLATCISISQRNLPHVDLVSSILRKCSLLRNFLTIDDYFIIHKGEVAEVRLELVKKYIPVFEHVRVARK